MPGLIHYSNVLKSRPYKANVLFDCLSHHLLINISHVNMTQLQLHKHPINNLITPCPILNVHVHVVCSIDLHWAPQRG